MLLQKLGCNYLDLTQTRITTGVLFLTAQIHKYVSSVSIYWHQSSYISCRQLIRPMPSMLFSIGNQCSLYSERNKCKCSP